MGSKKRGKQAVLSNTSKSLTKTQPQIGDKTPGSEKLLHHWNSMSLDNKRKLLQLNTDDLVAHFSSKSTRKILSEAFAFYQATKKWTFRRCCCCDKKFSEAKEYVAHIVKEHVVSLSAQQTSYLPTELNEGWYSIIRDHIWYPIDASAALVILEQRQWSRENLLTEDWPPSNYLQHISALAKVQLQFKLLLKNEFLAAEHVKMVTEYSMNRLEVILPGSRLREFGLDQTHLCICFLGVSELKEIYEFLDEMSKISKVIITEKKNAEDKIPETELPRTDMTERIELDGKSLCLLSDEDAVFKSMFSSSEEGLEKWVHLEKERKQQCKEHLEILKENVDSLKSWCDQKSELLRSKKYAEGCLLRINKELMARKHKSDHVPQSYEVILDKYHKELMSTVSEKGLIIFEKEVDSSLYIHGKSLAVVSNRICNLDVYEDGGDLAKPNPFQLAENVITAALKRTAKSIGLKLAKADAMIMRISKGNKKLETQLNHCPGADYRTILLPLVKSYVLAKLEKEANIAVEGKSEVAGKENQAHVAPETKKSVTEVCNQSKPKQKNAQNKPRGKDAREFKVHTAHKDHSLSHHAQINSHQDLESVGTATDDILKQEEERLRCQPGEEERMLKAKMRNLLKIEDGFQQNRAVQKYTEIGGPQQEDSSGMTITTTENTIKSSSTAAGASINNVPIPIHQTEEANQAFRRDTKNYVKRGANRSKQIQKEWEKTPNQNKKNTDLKSSKANNQSHIDHEEDNSRSDHVGTYGHPNLENIDAFIDADLKQKDTRRRCQMEQDAKELKMLDDIKLGHLVQKHTQAIVQPQDKMVIGVAQQEDTPGLTTTPTVNLVNNVRHGQQPQSTVASDGVSINNVPIAIAIDQAEAVTTSNKYLLLKNPLKHPALRGVVGLRGCSRSAAARLLALRWEAVIQAYNDPSTKFSERPVMYSEPDFLAELRHAIRTDYR